MWNNKKVSVIFPTHKEKRSIKHAIEEFDRSGFVDEIIVVNNNAEKGTEEEVHKTRALLIKETKQGYGYAIRKGLKQTKANLIIIAEPDGSFDGKDVMKLLAYSDDFDMVFGSRTHLSLVHKGSDMTYVKRILDVLLAKIVTYLYACSPLTDLGCTLRLTSRKAWEKIAEKATGADGIFATEWVLVAAKNKINFIEIPINFKARVDISPVSGTFRKKAWWGIRKFFYIWKIWLTIN